MGTPRKEKPKPATFDPDAASRLFANRARLAPKTPPTSSIDEENNELRQIVADMQGGKHVDSALLRKLGVPAKVPERPASAPPRTAEGARIETAALRTQARIDGRSAESPGATTPAAFNPIAFHQPENQDVATRLRLLEGTSRLPMFSTPESFANATARLVNRNANLTPEERTAETEKIFDRADCMRRYIDSANLPAEKVKEVMTCLLYTSPSPRDRTRSRMPSSA